jgi:hypothetical protein
MDKTMTMFDVLNSIFYKRPIKYDKKILNSYMLSMWLSHDVGILEFVNSINEFQYDLPDNIVYKYYYDVIPKKSRFIKWVKKDETKKIQLDSSCKEEYNLSNKEFANFEHFIENKPKKGRKVK